MPAHLAAFLCGFAPLFTRAGGLLPFFTSMFLHAGWMHVLGNMWFLYIFGDNIEDYLGHFLYLVFYILCGLLAMSTQVAIYPNSNLPTVGASGAIAGVLGAYFILYPRARVLTWFFVFVFYLPAWVVLGEWFVLNFLSGAADVFDGPYEGRYGGRGVLGAHWRICGGGSDGQVISGAKTTIAICLPLALFCSGDSRSASLVVSGAGRLFDR